MNPPRINQCKKTSNSELRDAVQVFCRLRPLQDECELPLIKLISPTTLAASTEHKSKSQRKDCNYVFRHVFTSYSTQREVFQNIALPLLEDLVNGKNGLLFTYGVTGSGKTFTLTGDVMNPGIMPLCIHTLFNSIGDKQAHKYLIKSDRMNGFEVQSESEAVEERILETQINNKKFRTIKKTASDKIIYVNEGVEINNANPNTLYSVFISYTEIYNNLVYDLLDEGNGKYLQTKIIREDSRKNMYVNGIEEVEVKSADEAFELLHLGQKRKRMAHTQLNAESSRSHSIFNIRIVQLVKNMQGTEIPSQTFIKVGQLSLVDLAGSERSNRTNNTGIRLKEASSINNSLMTLRSCLEILRENQSSNSRKVVPYRDSRLTLLFKNYFHGEGQVRMIVCINPSEQDCEENLQVLKFAEMTQEVQVIKAEPRYLQFKTPLKAAPVQTPKTTGLKNSSSLGPRIPSIKFNLEDVDAVQTNLGKFIRCLHARKTKGLTNDIEFKSNEEAFRKRLSTNNYDSVLLQSDVKNLKTIIKREKLSTRNQNSRMAHLESNNVCLEAENKELQEVIHRLQRTVEEKNLKINQNCLEHERHKQKLAGHNERLGRELDDELRKQKSYMENEMRTKDLRIKKVKEIIDGGDVVPVPKMPRYKVEDVNENINVQAGTKLAYKSTPSRIRPDDVWLEHNSVRPVALNTVLQPSIRKRKCVDVLTKASNVTDAKQSKYCLIAQETDGDGDVETKLYKGDIVPTCSGGAQVIINGVECLRQESPTKVPLSSNK